MPSTVPMAGSLQIAAALVFHLPGARLELSSPSGHRCSIGPMTDPRCTLHPAEFRELVVAAGDFQLLGTLLGFALVDEPTLTLTSSGIDMGHLGGGLYRVVGSETTSYAFTTSLPASQVDDLLTSLNTAPATGCAADTPATPHEDRVALGAADTPGTPHEDGVALGAADTPGTPHEDGVALCVSLVRDDGLGVTLVVISPFDVRDLARCEAVARASVSACLVAEMEQMTRCLDETPS